MKLLSVLVTVRLSDGVSQQFMQQLVVADDVTVEDIRHELQVYPLGEGPE